MAKANVRAIDLRFPVGGLCRRYGYQSQPPFTTPDAENVRPFDVLGRERGGRRPGLTKAYSVDCGGAIQFLCEVSVKSGATLTPYLFGVAAGAVDSVPFMLKTSAGALVDGGVAITGSAIVTNAGTLHGTVRGSKVYLADPDGVPKVFDASTGVVADLTATAGSVPTGCNLICAYRDRLVLAGADNLVYFSRFADPTNWDFARLLAVASDAAAPAVLNLGTDVLAVGERIVAIIKPRSPMLVMGCEHSLWAMQGNPAAGANLALLSRDVGIVGSTAYCVLADDSILFLGRNGLYMIPAGGGAPQTFSQELLPDEFLALDSTDTVSMSYDSEASGVHVSFTPASGAGSHWFIDLRTKSFWPVVFGADGVQPTYMFSPAITLEDRRKMLVGGRDGYLRMYLDSAANDDGSAFTGYIVYGPIRTGGPFYLGQVSELAGTLGESSGDVTWTVLSGEDGEDVVDSPEERATGTWTAGRNRIVTPRVASGAFGIKLSGAGIWSVESVGASLRQTGRQR